MPSTKLTTLFFLFALFLFTDCNQPGSKNNKAIGEEKNYQPYTEKTACLLSEIAYCTDPQQAMDKYLPGWKVVWNAIELGGNHAFIASDGTSYAIAIRGSLIEFSWRAFQNWIYQDLNIASLQNWAYTDDASKAKISQGAYEGWQNLNSMTDKSTGKTMQLFLDSVTTINTPVLITGHSLGGNLATVYASWLWQHFKMQGHPRDSINVITFAAPAAGNESFADDYDKKFPRSLRFENSNDIVPKFPCRLAVSALSSLYDSSLAASKIEVGYKNVTMPLSKVFGLLSTALLLLEFTNGNAEYTQTNGKGTPVHIGLLAKKASTDITDWFNEAGYQHGMAQYAAYLKVPVVECNP